MLAEVPSFHVETVGSGPRVLLVHGSVGNGESTWAAQRPLAERYTLVVPDRPGAPPNPPVEHVDFEDHAELLAPLLGAGAHVVGHSYGGVIALFLAGRNARLVHSLTLLEPPAFGLASGVPEVDAFVADLAPLWEDGPTEPAIFLQEFARRVIGRTTPRRLAPETEQGVRTLMVERGPWEAEPPLEELAAAPFPKLAISGAHEPAFDAVCDALADGIGARRAVLPGAAHNVQRAPGFNELLEEYLSAADSRA
jgi:pimeloyl-ACP methyl ester carboxylesterase